MTDADLLKKALQILGWDADRLKAELDREVPESGQMVSISTIYRWLAGSSPVHPGVKAFLRATIEISTPTRSTPPRTNTTLLIVSPGGAGRTPMAYEIAAMLRKQDILAGVREISAVKSIWHGIALGERLGFDIANAVNDKLDLNILDGPDIRSILDFGATSPTLKSQGKRLLDNATAVLIIGEPGPTRVNPFIHLTQLANSQKLPVLVAIGLSGCDGLPCKKWYDLEDYGASVRTYHKPPIGTEISFFKRCLDRVGSHDDPVTNSLSQTAMWLAEELGWDDVFTANTSCSLLESVNNRENSR